VHCTVCTVYSNALVPDPLDPQDFGFLDPDPDPRGKISTKNCKKKLFSAKTQILTFEKSEIIKISSFLNGSSSFRIKISGKK